MFKRRYSKPGSAPATLVSPPGANQSPVFHVMEYDETSLKEYTVSRVEDFPECPGDGKVRWLEMNGLGDVEALKKLGARYGLHPLALEDVLNFGQRPKMEPYGGHLFLVAQMIYRDEERCMCGEQVCLFVFDNILISVQEESQNDVFEPLRQRIRAGGGYARQMKADYLAYALLDSIVDHCFPVLEEIGEALEELEDDVLGKPDPHLMSQLHNFKRILMQMRRQIWPERDVVNALLHTEHPVVKRETKVFLRDLYDHTVQIMDLIESYRDVATGLMEMYLSAVSFRTNEIMRVLTIMSSIFIPLTFVAGVYGMNFENMPELKSQWGYFIVLIVMAAIAAALVYLFRRKKWL